MLKNFIKSTIYICLISFNVYAADIIVNSNSGFVSSADDGFCTFHEAIVSANTNTASGNTMGECIAGENLPIIDTIKFDSVILPTAIALELPFELIESAIIDGPHKDLLTLTTIGSDRVGIIKNIVVADFTIKGVTIEGGYAGIGTAPDNTGGGLLVSLSSSSLLLERVRFTNNNAEYAGGALSIGYAGSVDNLVVIDMCEFDNNSTIGSVEQINGNTGGGGAIFIGAFQSVEIYNSTFYDNLAQNTATPTNATGDSMGGAIWMLSSSPIATSELTIDSSTIDENQSYGVGGAISIGGPGFPADYSLVHIKHTTITRNTADANSSNTGRGAGGIYTSATAPVDIFNNVLATNNDNSVSNNRANLSGGFNTLGHNFINGNQGISTSFPIGLPNVNDDLVGSVANLPKLQAMSVTGGSTFTRSPMSDSPLLDQGRCSNKITDQRGYFNPMSQVRIINDNFLSERGGDFSDGCDIGAVEYSASESNAFPDGNDDSFDILEDNSITLTNNFNVLDNDSDPEGSPLVVLNAGLVTTNSTNINSPGDVDLWTNGDFTYTTQSNVFGSFDFTYNVSDGNMGSYGHVTVNILPVNDAPSFDNESEFFSYVGSNDIAGLHDYPLWAFNISTGPANESSQNAQFIVQVAGDTQIFASIPSVSPSGTLNLDIAENAVGSANITVTLQDNGGTTNGGIDESDDVIITVNANLDNIFSNSFEDQSGS